MSKIYEALKRLEREEAPSSARTDAVGRASRPRWLFMVGFFGLFVILGLGLVMFLKWRFPKEIPLGLTPSNPKMVSSRSAPVPEAKGKTERPVSPMVSHQKTKPESLPEGRRARSQALRPQIKPQERGAKEASKVALSPRKTFQPPSQVVETAAQRPLVPRLAPSSPDLALIVMAEEARHRGDYEKALRYYRLYIKEHEDPEVFNNLGALLLSLGRNAEAAAVLARAYRQERDQAIALNLALAYWRIGARKEACRIVRENLDSPSGDPSVWQPLTQRLGCLPPGPVEEKGP